jgi:hypothetical protein
MVVRSACSNEQADPVIMSDWVQLQWDQVTAPTGETSNPLNWAVALLRYFE